MNKNFKRFLAMILSMVLVVSLCPKIPVQAKAKTATVSTQKELNTALKSPDIKKINIKTDENISLALKGDASQKTITVNAANATISVKGNVGTLILQAVNSVVLGSKAAVSTIKITSPDNLRLKLKAGSTVDNLKIVGSDNANTSSSIKITNNGNIGNIRVNDENSQVSVVNNNSIGKILLGAATDLTVSGKTDSVTPVTVKKTAAGSSLTLSTDAKISAYADVKIDLLKGAGNTSIIARNEGINFDVSNNTKKDIYIKDKASGFSITVEKGATMSGEEIKNSVSSEVAKAEAEMLAEAKTKAIGELNALVGEEASAELKKILEDAVSKVNAAATLDDVTAATTNGKNAIRTQLDSEAKAKKVAEEAAQKAAEEAKKAAEEAAQKEAEEAKKAAEEAAQKLAAAKTTAIGELKAMAGEEASAEIKKILEDAVSKVNAAATLDDVTAAATNGKNAIQTQLDAEAEDRKAAEEAAQKEAEEAQKAAEEAAQKEAEEAKKAAEEAAQKAAEEAAQKLAAAKTTAIGELNALVGEEASAELKIILEDAVSKVNAAATLDDVTAAATNGKNAIQTQLDAEAEAKKAAEEAQKAAEEAQKAADDVKDLIDDIGTVSYTDECKEAIDKARTAYNELSDAAKSLVSSDYVQKLSDAAAEYAELEAEEIKKAEEAQKAAKEVTDLIDAIGTVEYSEDSKAAIDAAQAAYDELTDLAKSYVSSDYVQKLSDAAAEYETQKNNRKEETTDTFNMNGTLLECSVVTQYADGRVSVVEWSVTAEKMAAALTSNAQIVTADLVVSKMGDNPGPYLLERVTYTYHTENTWENFEQRFMYSEDRMYYEIVRKFTGTTYDRSVDKLTYSEMKEYDVVTLELKDSCVREETDIGYNTTWTISQKNSGSTQPKKIIIDEHYGTTYDPFKKTVKEYKIDSEDIEKIIVEECSKDDQYTTVVQTQMDGNGEKIGENTFIFDNNDYMYPYEPAETFITDIWKERYMKSFQNGCIVEENNSITMMYIEDNDNIPAQVLLRRYTYGDLSYSIEETTWADFVIDNSNGTKQWIGDKKVVSQKYSNDDKLIQETTEVYLKGKDIADKFTIVEYSYEQNNPLGRVQSINRFICKYEEGAYEKYAISEERILEYYGNTEQYKQVKLIEYDYDNSMKTITEITYYENGEVGENVISVVPLP